MNTNITIININRFWLFARIICEYLYGKDWTIEEADQIYLMLKEKIL